MKKDLYLALRKKLAIFLCLVFPIALNAQTELGKVIKENKQTIKLLQHNTVTSIENGPVDVEYRLFFQVGNSTFYKYHPRHEIIVETFHRNTPDLETKFLTNYEEYKRKYMIYAAGTVVSLGTAVGSIFYYRNNRDVHLAIPLSALAVGLVGQFTCRMLSRWARLDNFEQFIPLAKEYNSRISTF